MGKKVFIVLLAVLVVAVAADSAGAGGGGGGKIVFSVENLGDASAACDGALFGLSFDMVSSAGDFLGTGRSCVGSSGGCDPSVDFHRGCHATIHATFDLDFADGSVVAPMTLREEYPDPNTVRQHGEGTVSVGTGAYAGDGGVVEGGGTLVFDPFAIDLVYVVHLKP
jgi:hypothetical protein